MRVPTTIPGGPVASMPQDQVDTEFSHIVWTNFSGQVSGYIDAGRHASKGEWSKAARSAELPLLQQAASEGGKRYGRAGKHGRYGRVARTLKPAGRLAARVFGAPVGVTATALDYGPGLGKRYYRWAQRRSRWW